MGTNIEEKSWSFGEALPLVLATFFALVLPVLYRILIALLSALKSRRHSQMELDCEGIKGEEKGMCLSVVVNKAYELEEDILVEILSRLPVKILFKLKLVCRRWNAIISSPYLASLHLQNYTNGPAGDASRSLIIYKSEIRDFPFVHAEQLYPDAADASQIRLLEIPVPVITGPCNGIFLLGCFPSCYFYLWNPATGTFRDLPSPRYRRANPMQDPDVEDYYSCGLGLDKTANDLKVVLIRHFMHPVSSHFTGSSWYSSPEFPSQVSVYTLGTDSWRELEDFTQEVDTLHYNDSCRYLNGFVFWLCSSPVAALAFDLGTDVFRVINDPVSVPSVEFLDIPPKRLSLYGNSVALFIIQDSGGYDMWLLSEDWCWVKYLAISPFVPKDMMVVGNWGENQLILASRVQEPDNFEFILENGLLRQIVLFDPCTQTSKVLQSNCCHRCGFYCYKESLVNVGEMRLDECSYRLSRY